jgi:hypothetical protein
MNIQLFFAIIGALCSFGIVIMLLALVLFWSERHTSDTFGDGPPDVAAPGSVLCVFCTHKNHPPYLCGFSTNPGACACAGAPSIDEVAAAWARACADVEDVGGVRDRARADKDKPRYRVDV